MLELHKNYCIKEIENLKDFVTIAYVIIDDIYKKVSKRQKISVFTTHLYFDKINPVE